MNPEHEELEVCIDQPLSPELLGRAAEVALEENPENAPDGKSLQQFAAAGVDDVPTRAFAMAGKRWKTGRTLGIAFFDDPRATPRLRERIRSYADEWTRYANLRFAWGVPLGQADIRISLRPGGTWSRIGTDALVVPRNQPTMNFGWLTEDNVDQKARGIWHEFGHGAIGLGHEHKHPRSGISWNKPAVYAFYTGPPNNWTRARVDSQVFGVYSISQSNAGRYDPESIMHYAIPTRFVNDPADAVEPSTGISERDKIFVGRLYPFPKGAGGRP